MSESSSPLGITDVVLRDAHQSLLATRMRLDDMLPMAEKLDAVGFWSLESWGGATFDACIRYLGEDPWDRIRQLKKAMPKTPQQMLLRGQNILGYRHYADDVVEKFVERAAVNGIDVFRVFDAMNDVRNLEVALRAVKAVGKHAQGTLSYTVSPVHTIDTWVDMARRLEDLDVDSIAIKDMAGLLTPYVGEALVRKLKAACRVPIHMQCHATTGLSSMTILKCVEAGIDNVDTAISSMSMTYGHSPTESIVAALEGTDRDTGLDIELLGEIAQYFRQVRRKYAKFEGSLRGVDARILVAQVPGGMLTNMENQLREQGALDRFDEVLEEIPRVREDLGFIPLVTPTSQIVGTQSVLNVLAGERYRSITKETAGVLKGEYGATPAPVNVELQQRVLAGEAPMTGRPADALEAEMQSLKETLSELAEEQGITLRKGEQAVDDVLTYALFPQVGLRFLAHRDDPSAFEPVPGDEVPASSAAEAEAPVASAAKSSTSAGPAVYTVKIDGQQFVVEVSDGANAAAAATSVTPAQSTPAVPAAASHDVLAPLSGTVIRLTVREGDQVADGDVVCLLEAMKMETEVRADRAGVVGKIAVKSGDAVSNGTPLLSLS